MGGAPLRNWQNINLMHRFGPVGVLCLPTVPQEFDSSQLPIELPVWCIQPDPSRENAISKLTPRLRQLGWLLNQASAYRDKYFTREASQKLERILKEFQPDVIVFEEVWLYSYLSQLKGRDYTLILDAHNVEAALFRQIYNATKSQGLLNRLDTGIRLALIEAMERNFVQQVHQVWACSDHDATLLTHATAHASKKLTPLKWFRMGLMCRTTVVCDRMAQKIEHCRIPRQKVCIPIPIR